MALDPHQEAIFEKALAFVLEQEGGYSDDPTDHGGRTNKGITEGEYNAWLQETLGSAYEFTPVLHITDEQVRAIYLTKYWLPVHCGLATWPGSLALFDSVVNCGLGQGVKFLQRAIGVTDDGVMGPETQAAMRVADGQRLRARICDQRTAFYEGIAGHPGQMVFLRGWLNRVAALRNVQ